MTLYTSAINTQQNYYRRTFLIYLAASLFCAAFGAVYEFFSHGVYSVFMIGAFVFPLFGGTLPFLLFWLSFRRKEKAAIAKPEQMLKTVQGDFSISWQDTVQRKRRREHAYPGVLATSLYHCGIIAFTVGSLMTGVLEIYGTTNRLLFCYWLAGAALMLTGILIYVFAAMLPSPRKN